MIKRRQVAQVLGKEKSEPRGFNPIVSSGVIGGAMKSRHILLGPPAMMSTGAG
jgi:hypothetical protein